MLNEGNQIHNFISSSGSGTVIKYGSGSDFNESGSGSTRQKVTVPTVPVPVPQHCLQDRQPERIFIVECIVYRYVLWAY
jgi:hypothetical protein